MARPPAEGEDLDSRPVAHPPPEAIVEEQLDNRISVLEESLQADALAFLGRIIYGVDDVIRDAVEAIENKRKNLAVILETTGGYIEVTQRIADTFRHHYARVEFLVPNFAMSAGTVLVMSGDAIRMDYYSVLGPIDPQVERPGGESVPALGYLAQYERLIEKSANGQLTPAELAFLVEKFDPAELYRYEQARELSVSLLTEWLEKYKFSNWKKTRTRGRRVTQKMRIDRAEEIARNFNDTDRWHSHGRGISMAVLQKDLNLEIDDFGLDPELASKIKAYYKLLRDYMVRRRHAGVLHRRGAYVPIFLAF